MIIDGGSTAHGIESTIVAVHDGKIDILRRGPITEEQLSIFGEIQVVTPQQISAPGQLPSHYAPKTLLLLIDDAKTFAFEEHQRVGLLAWNPIASQNFSAVCYLSERQDLREAAANLFRLLRELDAMDDVDLIVAERVPDQGLGAAIMDRLRRAAHRSDATGRLR